MEILRSLLTQTGECFGAGVPNLIRLEVEGQGVERGGLAQTGECLGAGVPNLIRLEVEGQGVERGGLAQMGECLGAYPRCNYTGG